MEVSKLNILVRKEGEELIKKIEKFATGFEVSGGIFSDLRYMIILHGKKRGAIIEIYTKNEQFRYSLELYKDDELDLLWEFENPEKLIKTLKSCLEGENVVYA